LILHDTVNLAEALADRAFELGKNGRRVLVFCNSRDKLARVVAEDLRKRSAKLRKDATTVLLVGARRVKERELLTDDPVFRRFVRGEEQQPSEFPAFLVATSAGEVGVDLDADHMVCDLVAWKRMVQRLGRVNRSGRPEPAIVNVFAAVAKDDPEDEVADDLGRLRAPFESDLWPLEDDGRRQAGPGALRSLQADPEFAALTQAATREPLRPELSRALVDAWAMTSLEQHTGRPKVEPWLRGWVEHIPQTRIVWRSVLPVRDGRPDRNLLSEFFEALPPHLSEVLETEHYRVAEFLNKRSAAVSNLPDDATVAVLLDARGEFVKELDLGQLKKIDADRVAGNTVVVDGRLGGLSSDGLLDHTAADPPPTLDSMSESDWEHRVGRRLRIVDWDSKSAGWVREAGWPIALNEAIGGVASREASRSRDGGRCRTIAGATGIAAAPRSYDRGSGSDCFVPRA
jgi:CRISPR-associated endonuclease/helicase Cas3